MLSSNTSGVTGVYWHKGANKWVSRITSGGEHVYLGSFSWLDDAVAARKAAELDHLYHENHGRK